MHKLCKLNVTAAHIAEYIFFQNQAWSFLITFYILIKFSSFKTGFGRRCSTLNDAFFYFANNERVYIYISSLWLLTKQAVIQTWTLEWISLDRVPLSRRTILSTNSSPGWRWPRTRSSCPTPTRATCPSCARSTTLCTSPSRSTVGPCIYDATKEPRPPADYVFHSGNNVFQFFFESAYGKTKLLITTYVLVYIPITKPAITLEERQTVNRMSTDTVLEKGNIIPVSYTHLTLPTTPYV